MLFSDILYMLMRYASQSGPMLMFVELHLIGNQAITG